jgi:hypothetical protein
VQSRRRSWREPDSRRARKKIEEFVKRSSSNHRASERMLTSWQVSTALGENVRSERGDEEADAERGSYLAVVLGDSVNINEREYHGNEGCQACKGVNLTEGEGSVWSPIWHETRAQLTQPHSLLLTNGRDDARGQRSIRSRV